MTVVADRAAVIGVGTSAAATVAKRDEGNEFPFSLYTVARSEEFRRAGTVFIYCTNGRSFMTTGAGFCRPDDIILAEWGGENKKLVALYRARVVGDTVRAGGCILGWGAVSEVPLSQVADYRS